MAYHNGPTIAKDGLILYLDAANAQSYSGSGSTWTDLSGNGYSATMSNLTSSNWVTYNGVKAFETNDTNNQGFRVTSFPFPQYGRTYEIWLNSKSFSIGWQTWFDDGGGERILFGTSTNSIHIYPDVNLTSANLIAGNWYQLAYTMNNNTGSTAKGYKNGQLVGSGTYSSVPASGSNTLYILGDAGSEVTSCYCSLVRVYNRALTDSEILLNFETQKGRFGL